MEFKTRFPKFFAASLLVILISVPSRANDPAAFVQFVRPLGMGGAFTAVADDNNIFTYNPAGMVQRTGAEVTLLNLAVGGSKDLKDFSDFVNAHKDQLNNYENLTPEEALDLINAINTEAAPLHPRVYAAADVASYISGPHFMGMPIHVGFGAMGVADGTFKLNPVIVTSTSSIPNPTVSYNLNVDVVIPLSIAHRFDAPWIIPGKVGLGLTGKFISRGQIHQENVAITGQGDVTAPDPSRGRGLGSDLGVLYQPTDRINLGVMVQDLGGTKIKYEALAAKGIYPAVAEHSEIIRPQTNLGIALTPQRLLWLLPTGNRLTLSADMRNVTQENADPWGRDFWFHAKAGAEYRYWFLRFRAGVSDRYPTLGLGIDIPLLKIDYAFYSQELGSTIGTTREKNHVISLAIKFGTGATESRERIGSGGKLKEEKQMAVPGSTPTATQPASEQAPTPNTAAPKKK